MIQYNFILPLPQQQKFFMAKFNSIWGDLTVGTVTPVEPDTGVSKPEDDEGKLETKKAEESPKEDTDPAKKVNLDPKAEEAEDEVKPKTVVKDSVKPEAESADFGEEDVNKAFTILLDEGVLDEEDAEEFEATPEGFADAVSATVRKKFEDELNKIPPAVKDFYNHVISGEDPTTFKPAKAFSWEDADVTDEEIQKASLVQLYLDQGMTREEAEEEVEDVEASGKLAKKSGIAIGSLITKEQKQKDATAAAQQAEADAVAKKQQDEIDSINKTIDEVDEFAGFKMTDKRRKEFKDYIFKVQPRTGMTQLQANMSDESRKLKVAFLDFIEYNEDDIKKEVESELTKTRKKKLSRFTSKDAGNSNASRTITTPDKNKDRGKIKFPTIFGSSQIEVEG